MLKQYNRLMLLLLVLADAAAISAAWLSAYWLRFAWLPAPKGVPELDDKFLPMLPIVVVAHLIIFYRVRLYRPRRSHTILSETRDIVKAFFVAVAAVVLIDYAFPASHKISRAFVLTYAVVGATLFALFRGTLRAALRFMRQQGFNQRTSAIVGTGRIAQRVLYTLRRSRWTGYQVAYFVGEQRRAGQPLAGVDVFGPLEELEAIVERHPVDAIFVALPASQGAREAEVLAALEHSTADVRIVPDLSPAYSIRPNVGKLGDLPILTVRQTPLEGSNALWKRGFDVVVGSICLVIAAVPMLAIAGLVKLSSPGPVLYRQRRMGLDGCEFDMLKFRTMRADAETGGPVWSRENDPRRTKLGRFLRRSSLDELPQLFNVLRGEMSLVGPRPERPEFIAQFKHEIPQYMLRHKMKAGMTGIAQMRGYRGATSLKKRIQHDVFYIRNWSLWLDFRILVWTVFGVWFSRHEA